MTTVPDLATDPVELSEDEQLTHVILLWKQLLAHDELINARALLDAAPWRIRNHPTVEEMRRIVADMLVHVDDPAQCKAMYENYGGTEAIPMPGPIAPFHSQYPRFELARNAVALWCETHPSPPTVLDIGCMDGWISNRLGLEHKALCYGIDWGENNLAVAAQKAEQFQTGAKYARRFFGEPLPEEWPKTFDLVLLFEVYEHVDDTLMLVELAANHVSSGGALLITTPRGSWCQGVPVAYHERWNQRSPREHVRAPTMADVERDMRAVGLVNLDVAEFPMLMPDVPGQAAILAIGYKP